MGLNTVNEVKLIGHLGIDPEPLKDKSGKICGTRVTVYVDDSYMKNGAEVKRTYKHQVSLFGKLAEFARDYSRKGNQVWINAKLTTANYLNKDNQTVYVTQVVASDYGHQYVNLTPKGYVSQNAQNQQNEQETPFINHEVGEPNPAF